MTNESEKARWAKLAGLPKVEEESKQQLDEEDPDYLIYSLLEIITIVNNINEKK